MTYEQWLNSVLLFIGIGIIVYTYFKYYVFATDGERVFVKWVGAIGLVILVFDTIVSKVVI